MTKHCFYILLQISFIDLQLRHTAVDS